MLIYNTIDQSIKQSIVFANFALIGVIAKFVVSRCSFCKLRRNFGFFCAANLHSGPLRKHVFTCDWCISIHLVCFCVSRFAACDRPVSYCFGQWSTSFLRSFKWSFLSLSLARIKQCLPPALDKNSTHHGHFLRYSWAVLSHSFLFLRAKLGECVALWFALTPPPLKWLTRQKNPFKVCKRAARYNEFGYNSQRWESRPFEQTWRLWQFSCWKAIN